MGAKNLPSNQKINVDCVYFKIMGINWFILSEFKDE